MITRQQAEDQTNACFMYNAGGFLLAAIGGSLYESRSMKTLVGLWGFGVVAHAVALYGVPQARENILKWTAAGMEDRKRFQQNITRRVKAAVPALR